MTESEAIIRAINTLSDRVWWVSFWLFWIFVFLPGTAVLRSKDKGNKE